MVRLKNFLTLPVADHGANGYQPNGTEVSVFIDAVASWWDADRNKTATIIETTGGHLHVVACTAEAFGNHLEGLNK